MIEIEIRAGVHNFGPIKERLKNLKAEFVNKGKQADHIFGRAKDLDGEHKIIEGRFIARIREKDDIRSIEFKEIKRSGVGMEFSAPLASLETGLNFLKKLDFEKAFTIAKVREVYNYQDFNICLDDVERLGFFIEIEHPCRDGSKGTDALKECQNLLNLVAPDATPEPKKYGDLMQEVINKGNK